MNPYLTADLRTCRFCKKQDYDFLGGRIVLFKYGVRHYAHAECGLVEMGAAFFEKLPTHELRQFPALVAHHFKLLPKLEALLKERPS